MKPLTQEPPANRIGGMEFTEFFKNNNFENKATQPNRDTEALYNHLLSKQANLNLNHIEYNSFSTNGLLIQGLQKGMKFIK